MTHERMRRLLDGADFHGLFLELGWDNPPDTGPVRIDVDDTELVARRVADKKGVAVWVVICDAPPHGLEKRRVSLGLRKYSPLGRLVMFDTPDEVLFLWPERTQSGWDRHAEHVYPKRAGAGDAILQRLERLRFTMADQPTLTTLVVLDKMRLSFDVEKVTKLFYEAFKDHHKYLAECIKGIDDDKDRDWYASVLLNRLMFIYFIQRKGFMDDDRNYLRKRLIKVRELSESSKPYAFFRKFLMPLFHQALGCSNPQYDDLQIEYLIGRLPYVNGGIFETHQLEKDYDIDIDDKVFERLFKFFDKWRWHLDESPTGASNEISPHILGFIFEQSINQKETGAYYTKPDATRYMVISTIIPTIVDRFVVAGLEDPCILLAGSGADYIHDSLGYGVDKPLPLEELDPSEKPDISLDIALPGERWCDVLHRREKYKQLLERLSDKKKEWSIDESVTYNLDLTTLMDDYLSLLNTKEEIETAYKVLRSLKICDPTVGSGAFLLAALELLDPIYTAVIESARYLQSKRTLKYKDKDVNFLGDIAVSTNERYWMLKTACLNNLYGVDLVAEAAEIAKLRLFLKLVAQLTNITQVEPLPDLDFNIKVGNLLVGLADPEDAIQRFGDRLPLSDLNKARRAAEIAAGAYKDFISAQSTSFNKQTDSPSIKHQLENKFRIATKIANSVLHEMRNEQQSLDIWYRSHQPFHWFAEFPAVWQQRGFDVVIGNPPYINIKGKRKNRIHYSWWGYVTQNCPDIYAVCTERASSLLNGNGRLAMIVMHSLCFNDKFRTLRHFLDQNFPSLWISSYANIPDGLFSSAWVRNSIIFGSKNGEAGLLTARCRRWTAISREAMFNGVEYIHPHDPLLTACGNPRWPFIDDIDLSDAFTNLVKENAPLSTILTQNKRGSNLPALWYKNVARYILGIAHDPPPRINYKGVIESYSYDKVLYFSTTEHRDLSQLILSGRWGYLWWLIFGDEFSVTKGVITSFPAGLNNLQVSVQAPNLLILAIALQEELPKHLKFKANAGLKVGRYDLRECRYITDKADWLLAKAWGLTKDQYYAAGSLRDRMTFGQKD